MCPFCNLPLLILRSLCGYVELGTTTSIANSNLQSYIKDSLYCVYFIYLFYS